MPKLTAKPAPVLASPIAALKPAPDLVGINANLATDNARLLGLVAASAERLAIALDLPGSVGLTALTASAVETIAALRLEADSRPILPETAREEWKAELVARIDAMPSPDWKVSVLASILAHSEPVDPAAVTAALARLVGASGKVAVKNGLGVISAIHAAGHRVVRQIDGDLIVAVR